MAYDPSTIEPRWQKHWEANDSFRTDTDSERPSYYVLDMFPYPSGSGLHVGHVEGYTGSDIVARYKRMKGFEVLHPMGWDAFGLPAEQYAIEQGVHPEVSTKANVDAFRKQLKLVGFSYDWDREFGTYDADYYRWTQWIFLKLFEKGLAYQSEALVNWCPALGTVLANDEVIDGKSERGSHPVERKPMKQWMLRITEYADRLLEGLERVDFPESIKAMQRDRIGRSEGADATFAIVDHELKLEVFTTRPDTMFGATFCVLSPEHSFVGHITTAEYQKAVDAYRKEAAAKSEIARTGTEAGKSGVFTGAFAINPVTKQPVQIWVADYVLMSYGTGAIMCVPGHDERDWAFATKFGLPIVEVLKGGKVDEAAFTGDGPHVNSDWLNGLGKEDGIAKMIDWLVENKVGQRIVRYRLRDWIFARQRYWGEPIPIVHDADGKPHPVADGDLPVTLPRVENYQPTGTGESPLASMAEWIEVDLENGAQGQREADTMPGSAGSSWYFMRFIDPENSQVLCDPIRAAKWLPVDLYLGGAEHAVGHLLYSRFWTKFLYDLGVCPVDEPFAKLVNQGMILGNDGRKMGKRFDNSVDPSDVVASHGADALRIYEMFMGPIEQEKPWSDTGLDGARRFLNRVWRLFFDEDDQLHAIVDDSAPEANALKVLHQTIDKVDRDSENLRFNTAISQMMIFVNEIGKMERRPRAIMEPFVLLLAPYAPHIAEEIWRRLGHQESLIRHSFPAADPALLIEDEIEIPVQINGKVRAKLKVSADIEEDALKALALAHERVQAYVEGKEMKVFRYIPGRMITIAVK
ncbi:MAG: leucine--tRNA ligase [Planctomycetota bacterium]